MRAINNGCSYQPTSDTMAYYIQKQQGPNKGKFVSFNWDMKSANKWVEDYNKGWNFDFVTNAQTFIKNSRLKDCVVIKMTSI